MIKKYKEIIQLFDEFWIDIKLFVFHWLAVGFKDRNFVVEKLVGFE